MPVLNTVVRKGTVYLPQTLILPDDHPVTVTYDEPAAKVEPPKPAPVAEIPRHQAPVYPEEYPDLGEDTYDWVAPPPEDVRVVKVRIIDAGPQPPVSYRDEE